MNRNELHARDSEGSLHLEAYNYSFIFGIVVGGSEPEDGSFWCSEDYPNSDALTI